MRIEELDYHLPEKLIADRPMEPRDKSRLMVVHRKTGQIEHKIFSDLTAYLNPADVLVLNSARVTPARLFARSSSKSNERVFELLIAQYSNDEAVGLVKPSKRIKEGSRLWSVGERKEIIVQKQVGEGMWKMQLAAQSNWSELFKQEGHMPLPPYILKQREKPEDVPEDHEWYQTRFADRDGAIAAPTAGLHFSQEMLSEIEKKGVQIAKLFLKVGIGTFMPIRTEEIEKHRLLPEEFELSKEAAEAIEKARGKSRIVAVGTTVTRTLESNFQKFSRIKEDQGATDLFITLKHSFRVVDAFICQRVRFCF
jgi:S-adenosylmethionine:tRNA ribosyltransferase-isomerase